jgi:hypothetical protein
MAPEPVRPKPVQVEDLRGLLEREHPVDLADISLVLDVAIQRLDTVYSKIASPLPDHSTEEDREWRHANRSAQVEQAMHALCREAIERYKAR